MYIFVHLGALCFMMFHDVYISYIAKLYMLYMLPSCCDEADYFYVVQSGSFQVSKTEAAASAEKILGWDGMRGMRMVQISCRFRADFVQTKTFLLKVS